ncbi:MAG: aminoglycoside phosphotransferase family protein, partial [Pseudomonadota bacterium]
MTTEVLHQDELPISTTLVRNLVDTNFPEYKALSLRALSATGSSNRNFRLGDEYLVRLPRQPGGGESIDKEARWTSILGNELPVAVPDIVGVGAPAMEYPEQWSIVRWQPGSHPSTSSANRTDSGFAKSLAELIGAFRKISVTQEAQAEPSLRRHYRGNPLYQHDRRFRENLASCKALSELDLDLDAALVIWEEALSLPASPMTDDHWFHGDIVAENLLLDKAGQLTGLLDFGGVGLGDPTVDLHGCWEILDADGREIVRQRLGLSDEEWLRGRAWALAIAMMTFPY